jgi:hypothetical protein
MLRRKKHLAMVDGTEYPYTHSITLTSPEDGFDAVYSLLEKVWIDASNVETIDRLGFETALIELVSNVFQHVILISPHYALSLSKSIQIALNVVCLMQVRQEIFN